MLRCFCSILTLLLLLGAPAVHAMTVDLADVLGNSGYEDDAVHGQWTVTRPTTPAYQTNVPVNPTIAPLDPAFSDGTELSDLVAPDGNRFVGVLNPTANDDRKGKLAHDSLGGSFASDTVFQVVVWGNRGRLGTNGNTNSGIPAAEQELRVQFLGWGSGSAPTVDASDDWSRNPLVKITLSFSNWGDPGQWTSELFSFAPAEELSYVALSIAGLNNNHDQYVAWDVAVPEPATALLLVLALGLVFVARSRAQNWK